MTRLQFRQTVVVVILVMGTFAIPRAVAKRRAMEPGEGSSLAGQTFLNTFGN